MSQKASKISWNIYIYHFWDLIQCHDYFLFLGQCWEQFPHPRKIGNGGGEYKRKKKKGKNVCVFLSLQSSNTSSSAGSKISRMFAWKNHPEICLVLVLLLQIGAPRKYSPQTKKVLAVSSSESVTDEEPSLSSVSCMLSPSSQTCESWVRWTQTSCCSVAVKWSSLSCQPCSISDSVEVGPKPGFLRRECQTPHPFKSPVVYLIVFRIFCDLALGWVSHTSHTHVVCSFALRSAPPVELNHLGAVVMMWQLGHWAYWKIHCFHFAFGFWTMRVHLGSGMGFWCLLMWELKLIS